MKKINLISLARCPERQESMIRQFAETGLEYRYIEAVDGKDPSVVDDWEVDHEAFRKIYKRDIRPGEIGCYASHLKALETIVGTEADYGIVMEDDVVLTTRELSTINRSIESGWELHPDASLFYPGNPLMWGSHRYLDLNYGEKSQAKFNEECESVAYEVLEKALIGTQCYIISVDFAHHILTHWNTIYRPIDEVFRVLCQEPKYKMVHFPRHLWWCRPNWEVPSEITG